MQYIRTPQQLNRHGTIAYTSNRGGSFDIWLNLPPAAIDFPLTRGLGESHSTPYWSPDSRNIAFIGKMNIIFIVDTRTAAAARIDQVEPYTLLDWSPDSRFLSYVKDGHIMIYNVFSHTAFKIVQEGAYDIQWFPSGRELLFAAPDSAGISQLYQINADGSNKRQLTRISEGPIHNVRLSPNGRFALFTSPGVSISLISTVDLATGEVYSLQGGPLAKNYYPEWSPDSSLIAYSATAFDQNTYYSLIQTDTRTGRQQKVWASSNCFAAPVSWSPYGHQIAYLSGCGSEEIASQIWIVDLRRSMTYKITEGGRIAALQWSPSSFAGTYF